MYGLPQHIHFLPLTTRDFFFTDPHFRTTWNDFDALHRAMQEESRKYWTKEEAEQMLKAAAVDAKNKEVAEKKKEGQQQQLKNSGDVTRAEDFGPSFAPWFFPRRWLLPKLLGGESDVMDEKLRDLNLFQYHGDDQVIRLVDDNTKFEVSLDAHGFNPEELKVRVQNGKLTVEAKHEVNEPDKYVCKHFIRYYSIPEDCDVEAMKSNLSSDGVLVVTAPKKALEDARKAVPIEVVKDKESTEATN